MSTGHCEAAFLIPIFHQGNQGPQSKIIFLELGKYYSNLKAQMKSHFPKQTTHGPGGKPSHYVRETGGVLPKAIL